MAKSAKSNTDRILGITGTAIAIAAFGLSIFNACGIRTHNKLLVKPRLSLVPQRGNQDPAIGLLLSNKGMGLAVVESWTVSLDGTPMKDSFTDGWNELLAKARLPFAERVRISSSTQIPAGESAPVFSIDRERWNQLTKPEQDTFNQLMSRIKVSIAYHSDYDEKDKCEW